MSENRIYLDKERLLSLVSDAPLYQKADKIVAVPAQDGETVRNIGTANSGEISTAKEGDFIVTNLNGERYLMSERKLCARYHSTDEDGVWQANGVLRAVSNPENAPISITAPWGEMQFGDIDCLIAVHVTEPDQPYLISYEEFIHDYVPAVEE